MSSSSKWENEASLPSLCPLIPFPPLRADVGQRQKQLSWNYCLMNWPLQWETMRLIYIYIYLHPFDCASSNHPSMHLPSICPSVHPSSRRSIHLFNDNSCHSFNEWLRLQGWTMWLCSAHAFWAVLFSDTLKWIHDAEHRVHKQEWWWPSSCHFFLSSAHQGSNVCPEMERSQQNYALFERSLIVAETYVQE